MAKRSRQSKAGPNPPALQRRWPAWCQKSWLPLLAIAILVLIAYLPTFRAGFVWDDDHYVVDNPCLRTWEGLRAIWLEPQATPQYYPLTQTSFWLEYQLWGLNPTGYHVLNVLLHLASALCLGRLLGRLAVPGAWLVATLFAVHPVAVESVAWVTERKNVLSLLFYLASLSACLRALGLAAPGQAVRFSRRHYALGLVLFLLALLSKTVTCSLPAVLLVLVWWKRGQLRSQDLLAAAPLATVGLMLASVTVCLEKWQVGATGADWQLTAVERLLVAGRAVWFYAGKLLWPADLTFIYPRWQLEVSQAWQWAFPLGVVVVLGALWKCRQRLGRGPLAGVLVFVGTLVPALGFFDVYPMRYSFVADHFQYLAMPALLAMFVALGYRLVERCGWMEHPAVLIAPAMVVVGSVALSYQHTQVFHDAPTLWRDTLAKNPACWLALNNLANLYVREDKAAEAIPLYCRAAVIRPGDAETRMNLGAALLLAGDPVAATAELSAAVRLDPRDAGAFCNLARAQAAAGQASAADQSYEQAVRLAPESAEVHFNFGLFLLGQQRLVAAERELATALRLDPDHVQAHLARAAVLARRGRRLEAIAEAEHAQRLSPDNRTAEDLISQLLR